MATKGTRGTSIDFGGYEITAAMKKAAFSRDLKTEVVDSNSVKVSGGGGFGGGRRKLADGESRAVRLSETDVIRLPQEELDRIEAESKDRWSKMEVLEAIDYRQVPTERIQGSYWLQPAQGSAQGMYLLHKALSDTTKVAVVKWISTSREKLGVIRPRWVKRDGEMLRALLLSELAFANDFLEPDEDALAINDAELMMEHKDPLAHLRAIETARSLIVACARERGDEKLIDAASDSAVDARLALFDRIAVERTERELAAAAGALTLLNVVNGTVTWDDDVDRAFDAAGIDPDAVATPEQIGRAEDRSLALRGVQRALWIASGLVADMPVRDAKGGTTLTADPFEAIADGAGEVEEYRAGRAA